MGFFSRAQRLGVDEEPVGAAERAVCEDPGVASTNM